MDKVYLTREGYEKLRKELEYLKTIKRREISKQLEHARSLGDLRENAEYDAAKNAQAFLEKRIDEMEQSLSGVSILDDTRIDKTKVLLGATVKLKDLDSGEVIAYTMVNKEEADISQNKIAIVSPVGKALLGHKVDDTVEVEVPAGIIRYKVIEIAR